MDVHVINLFIVIVNYSRTVEESVFKIAKSLAIKYDIAEYDLYMMHLDFLFSDSGYVLIQYRYRHAPHHP